jgi:NAD(P)-dependent dehydrogenase (short-subunit alcohol dehydrogenase family)
MSDTLERLFSLEGKVALVTGASGGIGGALAAGLAGAGASVAAHGSIADKTEATCAAIKEAGGNALPFVADLAGSGTAARLAADVEKAFGRIDILVNCAGTNRRRPAREATEADFDFITAVNLKSLYFLCQAVYPVMRRLGGGKIVNIGSVTSTDGLGGVSVYGMTKAAVGQLTKTLALEWAKDNIQVNCLAPGFFFTPLTEKGIWGDPHRNRWALERIPMGRAGQPDELVGAALLLSAPASSYLTGHTLNVDGGYLAGGSWLKEGE